MYVDGVPLGHPTYNNYRVDIATLFPGLNNSLGAIGFQVLNTTQLADGLHTIAWTATDNRGATEGLGSRYFRLRTAVPPTGAPAPATARVQAVAAAPPDSTPRRSRPCPRPPRH